MHSRYAKMRPLGLVIWRLRHSRLRREFHAEVIRAILAAEAQSPVLDVGCGPGLLARRLVTAKADLRVICVDVEPRMLEAARAAGCRDLVRASADLLPFRPQSFPLVVSTASLKDWMHREAGLAEITRVLGPGGRAFVYDFLTVGPGSNPPGFRKRFGVIAELLRRRMGRMIPFSVDDLRTLGDSVRSDDLRVTLGAADEFGAASLVLSKAGAR
jgi:ubiquinone/menaquinone biosynthesis C-methylase UbiE